MQATTTTKDGGGADGLGGFVQRIGDDLRILAHDEVELAREEIQRVARGAAAEAAMLVIASLVAVIGLGMLCVSAVVAADVLVESLAIRLLVMTAIYLALGGLVARYAFSRITETIRNPLTQPVDQAKRTVRAVKNAVRHAEEPHHA